MPPPFKADRLGEMLDDATIFSTTGLAIGTAHRGRPVHIIGIKDGQVHIRKHDGQEGFIDADSVADVGAWIGSMPERAGSP